LKSIQRIWSVKDKAQEFLLFLGLSKSLLYFPDSLSSIELFKATLKDLNFEKYSNTSLDIQDFISRKVCTDL